MWQNNDIVNAASLNSKTEEILRAMQRRNSLVNASFILQQMRPILCVNRTGGFVQRYYTTFRIGNAVASTDEIPTIVSSGGKADFHHGTLVVPTDNIPNGETGYCWVEGFAIVRLNRKNGDTPQEGIPRYININPNLFDVFSTSYGSNCPVLMYVTYNHTQYALVNINKGTKRRYEYYLSTSAFGFTRDDLGGDEYWWPDEQYPPIEYTRVDHNSSLYFTEMDSVTHNRPFGAITDIGPIYSETGEKGTWQNAFYGQIVSPGDYVGVRNYGINANPRRLIATLAFTEI